MPEADERPDRDGERTRRSSGADGGRSRRRPGPVLARLFRAPSWLYDRNLGWLLGRRFLRLTHTGRRSGRTYRTVLEVIGRDDATGEVLVISGLGGRSDWYRNLLAGGPAEVEIGRDRFPVVARTLDPDEAVAVFADYERRNRALMPVFRRFLGLLTGRPYDGTNEARRRLVSDLPIVALRPTTRR